MRIKMVYHSLSEFSIIHLKHYLVFGYLMELFDLNLSKLLRVLIIINNKPLIHLIINYNQWALKLDEIIVFIGLRFKVCQQ